MAGFEDIPKKEYFTTPEHYFDKLPAKIQSRVLQAEQRVKRTFDFRYALRYTVPLILIACLVWYYNSLTPDAETILASVETEELINYLQESGMTTEDMLENIELTPADLEAIEDEVYDLSPEGSGVEVID